MIAGACPGLRLVEYAAALSTPCGHEVNIHRNARPGKTGRGTRRAGTDSPRRVAHGAKNTRPDKPAVAHGAKNARPVRAAGHGTSRTRARVTHTDPLDKRPDRPYGRVRNNRLRECLPGPGRGNYPKSARPSIRARAGLGFTAPVRAHTGPYCAAYAPYGRPEPLYGQGIRMDR